MSDLQNLVWSHSMLALALKSTFIFGGAWILTLLLRRRSASLRHWIWAAAFGSALLLPIAMSVVPQWLPSPASSTALDLVPNSMWQDPLVASLQGDEQSVSSLVSLEEEGAEAQPYVGPHPALVDLAQGRRTLEWLRYTAIAWASVTGLLLMLFVMGLMRSRRLVRGGFPVVDEGWRKALQEAKETAGVGQYLRILESKHTKVPLAAGIFRPSILLPVNANDWAQRERVQVLVHELSHIQRRDNLTQAIAFVATSFLWFQPLCWLGLRQMKRLRELAADDAVVRSGERSEDYGEVLVRVARRAKGQSIPATASVASASGLVGRIEHLLGTRRRNRLSPSAAALSCFVAAMSIAVVGSMGFNPVAAFALQSELRLQRSHARTPLFQPAVQGSAQNSYQRADALANEHVPPGSQAWSGSDATFREWPSAPVVFRDFGSSETAQAIAALVVEGASHTEGNTGLDSTRHPTELVDTSVIRLSNAVLAASYAQAESGEEMLAVKSLMSLARLWDDRTRANGLFAMVMASGLKLHLLPQIDELAAKLNSSETRETLGAMQILLDTTPGWGDTIRSESLWAVWIAPIARPDQVEELAVAMDNATSTDELERLAQSCTLPFCEGSMLPKVIHRWGKVQAMETGVYLSMASRLYRDETGHAPQRLDDLVPTFLPAVPLDPRTGEAFHLETYLEVKLLLRGN